MTSAALPRSLYVHIPFCASKCFYCDFTSYVTHGAARAEYTGQVQQELRLLHGVYWSCGERPPLDTVFFGGGTPTLLSAQQWREIGQTIHTLFQVGAETEWTAEANPGTVSCELLQTMREIGVNRLSFGAQTFNETLLQAIGRIHSADDILRSVELARASGFARINLDLMLGLPDQTAADVKEALAFVEQAGVAHVSAYGLKVEPNTPFAKWEQAGHLSLPSEEDEVFMYEMVQSQLRQRGFRQYEISNFAKPGEEARHNLVYWRNLPYLAVGAGAHGYVLGQRYENMRSLLDYGLALEAGKRPLERQIPVPPSEAMENTMMLGLRLRDGVAHNDFESLHGQSLQSVFGDAIARLRARGLLCDDGVRVFIPERHYEVANEIFAQFVGVL